MPCIGYCMFSNESNPSTIGLLMIYAFTISLYAVFTTHSVATFETKMVSIERIYNFMAIEPEQGYVQYCLDWQAEE
jgi:ABC-type multidrug transport system fused ATPase/permease subunit